MAPLYHSATVRVGAVLIYFSLQYFPGAILSKLHAAVSPFRGKEGDSTVASGNLNVLLNQKDSCKEKVQTAYTLSSIGT